MNAALDTTRSDASSSSDSREHISCAVCYQIFWEPVRWPTAAENGSCSHIFCKSCVRQWATRSNPSCPLCRAPAAGDVLVRELEIDQATVNLVKAEAPKEYAARMLKSSVENRLRHSLPELLLYSLGKRCDFKVNQTISLHLKSPVHLWLAVKLLAGGERRIGLLHSVESDGSEGRLAFVTNMPFGVPKMAVDRAKARVLYEWHQNGFFCLKLRIASDFFRAVYIDHRAVAAEEDAWRSLVVSTSARSANVDTASRLPTGRIVLARTEADLDGAVAVAEKHASEPVAELTADALSARSDSSERSHNSDSSDRFGPYHEFGLAHAVLRRLMPRPVVRQAFNNSISRTAASVSPAASERAPAAAAEATRFSAAAARAAAAPAHGGALVLEA